MHLLQSDIWVCHVALQIVHWDFYLPRNPHDVAKRYGREKQRMNATDRDYLGVLGEDRHNILPSSMEDRVQDEELETENKAGAWGVPLYLDMGSKKAGGRPEEIRKSHALLFLGGGRA